MRKKLEGTFVGTFPALRLIQVINKLSSEQFGAHFEPPDRLIKKIPDPPERATSESGTAVK